MDNIKYYKKEDVDKFLLEHGIELIGNELREYWNPILNIKVDQCYVTGPGNIIPTVYFSHNNIFQNQSV